MIPSLTTVIGSNLYMRLQNAEWEGRKHMGYLAEFAYNKFKGILTESSYSWDDLMEQSLNKLPSLENNYRTIVSQIYEQVKDLPENIPEGTYCYSGNTTCPYWTSNPFAGDQNSGVCLFRNEFDCDTPGFALLWDQVKSCNINEGEEYDD